MNEFDIKKIREQLNVSQEKLAEMLGVHPSAINLENQGFAKLVHEFVHESPIFGAFFMSFLE